jgi:nitrite reductase (NO-forming)
VAEPTTPRVKVVQAQARRALLHALAFGVAAALAAAVPHRTGAWLPLHLFLVGSLLLAISGATRLFTVTWSAGQPRGDAIVGVQRWLLTTGAAGLALARERAWPTGVTAGLGLCVTAALVLLGWLLAVEARSARVRRFHPAVAFYLVAVAAGVAGTGLGAALVTGRTGIRDAHVIVNLLGLVGLVIAGTLPFFTATQVRMKMARRATASRSLAVLAVLSGGVAVGSVAAGADQRGLLAVALGAYAVGLGYLGTLLPRPGAKQRTWAGPRLAQLALGGAWWIAIVLVAAGRAAAGHDPFPERLVVLLVVGAYAQILVASLAYLGPVLRAGGHVQLSAGFAITRSWVAIGSANIAAGAWAVHLDPVAVAAVALLAGDVAWRAALLVARRGATPPPT